MHAASVLQKCLPAVFHEMHVVRARALIGAVQALLLGRRLILMDLARAWPGAERVRAPLKCLDRLLSNRHVQAQRPKKVTDLFSTDLVLVQNSPTRRLGASGGAARYASMFRYFDKGT